MKIGTNYNFKSLNFSGLNNDNKKETGNYTNSLNQDYKTVSSDNLRAFYCTNVFSCNEQSEIKKEIDKIFCIKKTDSMNWSDERRVLQSNNLTEFSNNIFDVIQKHSLNTPNKIIRALEQNANISDEQLENISNSFSCDAWKYTAFKKMQIKRELLQNFLMTVNKFSGDWVLKECDINDLKLSLDSKVEKINNKYNVDNQNKRVKDKIQYNKEDDYVEEKIILNDKETEELKELARTQENLPMEELCQKAINIYVGGDYSLKDASENVQKAVLYSQPRYDSKLQSRFYDGYNDFDVHPVVRWLWIKEPDKFVENFNNGDTYKYEKLQSCSKNCCYCENQFSDETPENNVKFVIHPKSEISKARDIGERKYGSREVIYPPNQEFVILDKQLVKYHSKEEDFYRWIIHLQEK